MKLKINGKLEQFTEVMTIGELLRVKGLEDQQLLVEHNGVMTKSDSWSGINLNDGDVLEILRLVGGG